MVIDGVWLEFSDIDSLNTYMTENGYGAIVFNSDIIAFDAGFVYRENSIRLYKLDTVGIDDCTYVRMFNIDGYIVFVDTRVPEKIYLYEDNKLKRISITSEGNRKRFRIYGHKYSYNKLGVQHED